MPLKGAGKPASCFVSSSTFSLAGFFHVQTQSLATTPRRNQVTKNSIRLTSSRELLAIVPFVLNFHPRKSIMVMSVSQSRLG